MKRDFSEVLAAGRRRAGAFLFFPPRRLIVSLDEITSRLPARGTRRLGVRSVPVWSIAGTEDRGDDFAPSFLPVRHTMEKRWTRVRDLFLEGHIEDPIQLIEFGGVYFVRDGNHRVSVARAHRIDYVDADVVSWSLPITLPHEICRDRLYLYEAKLAFHDRTNTFAYIPDTVFGDAYPDTWNFLEDLIFEEHRRHVETVWGREPSAKELVEDWFELIYANAIELIRREATPTLFPRMHDLDIFRQLIAHWREMPSSATLPEAFDVMMSKAMKRRRWKAPLLAIDRLTRDVRRTVQDEREHFFHLTRMHTFVPGACIPDGRKDWYRFLKRQVLYTHHGYLRQKLGRKPSLDELVRSWYEDLFQPARRLYESVDIPEAFSVFYMGWMPFWHRSILRATRSLGYARLVTLEESFHEYLEHRGWARRATMNRQDRTSA